MNLDTYFPYQLAATADAFSRKLTDVYGREYGLSREEWRLLLLLADAKEITSRELARKTTLDKVQVSRAAQKLDDKGLITRAVAPDDKRLKVYACTAAGVALFAQMFPKVENQSAAILDRLSPEDRKHLEAGLKALKKAVSEHDKAAR